MKSTSFKKAKRLILLFIIPFLAKCFDNESILQSHMEPDMDNDISELILSKAPTKITLKVLLVEFADVKHRNPIDDNKSEYTYQDFENLLFSNDIYVSPNKYSPDGEEVFGSLRDYYYIMSNGRLDIDGDILNNDSDTKGVPEWLQLSENKSYYQNRIHSKFCNEVISLAEEAGLRLDDLGKDIKLAIIYAGHMYRRNTHGNDFCGLKPRALYSRNTYIISEQFAPGGPYNIEHDQRTFSHIGTHAHEFGHLLGCKDHYYKNTNDNLEWGLMGRGNFNGPRRKGECPATLNPYYRWKFGWINFETVNPGSSIARQMEYSLRNPEIYQLRYEEDKFFMVEYRKFNSTMRIGQHEVKDYNSYIPKLSSKEGILVWRKLYGSTVQLMFSGGAYDENKDAHIFPGINNVRILTPWSDNRNCNASCLWVPNTKNSTNCGMEIISSDPGNFIVELYGRLPELTTPSRPKGVGIKNSSNVQINWVQNGEPDLEYYKIYKKKQNDSKFKFFGISAANSYTDNTELRASRGDRMEYVYYYVTAFDIQNKESASSRIIKVKVKSGYREVIDAASKTDQHEKISY